MKKSWEEIIINGNREDGKYHNPSSLQLGIVKSINPLQVELAGLPIGKGNLLINKQLLDYTENVETETISTITHKSILNVGDSVVLYLIENKYLLLGVFE